MNRIPRLEIGDIFSYCLSRKTLEKGGALQARTYILMDITSKIYDMYEWGVKLFISGKPATPQMVEDLLKREGNKRMPMICFDKNGEITEILF